MSYMEIINDINEKKFSNMYLFHGEEIYLIENSIKLLKETIVDPAYEDFNYSVVDGKNIEVLDVINTINTLPFFSEQKVVIVKDTPYFKSGKNVLSDLDEERIMDYIQNPSASTVLIFWCSEVDKRKKLYKSFSKNGKVIEFSKLNDREFYKWVGKRFRSFKKKIEGPVIGYFVDYVGYLGKNSSKTLMDIDNEITKVCNAIGDRTNVEKKDIEDVIPKPLENNIFDLIDALGGKNIGNALVICDNLLLAGEAEIKIISMISNHFRTMLKVKVLLDRGYNASTAASKLGIHPFVAKKHANQCRFFSKKSIVNSIRYAIEIDEKVKSGKISQKLAVEKLIVLCGLQNG